jgi:hypothetical protein
MKLEENHGFLYYPVNIRLSGYGVNIHNYMLENLFIKLRSDEWAKISSLIFFFFTVTVYVYIKMSTEEI